MTKKLRHDTHAEPDAEHEASELTAHQAPASAAHAADGTARVDAVARAIEAQSVVLFDLRILRDLVSNGAAAAVSQVDALIVNAEAASAAVLVALKA